MPVFKKVKDGVNTIRSKTKGHHKWKMFLYAGILVSLMFCLWLFGTNTGWLARQSFTKSFDHHPDRIVTLYSSDGTQISQYIGEYSVEQYQGYLVILDHKKQERINVYGDVSCIVDSPNNLEGQQYISTDDSTQE